MACVDLLAVSRRRKRRLHQFRSLFLPCENRVRNLAAIMTNFLLMVLQALGKGAQVKRRNYLCNIKQQKDLIQTTNFRYVLKWSLRGQLHEKRVQMQVTNTIYLVLPLPEPQIGSPLWEGIRGINYGILLRVKRR